jgi:hypothetical protein
MRFGLMPFFEIDLSIVVPLFLLRISLPWLIRLLEGALVGLLTWIVFWASLLMECLW